MADKPIYYGGKGSSPIYYGGRQPIYYGGAARRYGGAAYGGHYGVYGGVAYGGQDGDGTNDSVVGTITLSRMLRVISQRWLSVFVFLIVGLIVSFAVYRISPTIYQATSEFTMDMRRFSGGGRNGSSVIAEATPDYGNSYAEIFNTRLSDWRSEKIATKIVQQYRASRPSSTVSDEDIVSVLSDSEIELVRN